MKDVEEFNPEPYTDNIISYLNFAYISNWYIGIIDFIALLGMIYVYKTVVALTKCKAIILNLMLAFICLTLLFHFIT